MMNRVALAAACAGIFLCMGSMQPAAQARSYYSYGAHTPAKGSAERSAIMAAIHARTGITELLIVEHLRVSRGWAWAVVHPEGVAAEGVLLHGSGSHWYATDVRDDEDLISSPSALRDEFPNVPSVIFR